MGVRAVGEVTLPKGWPFPDLPCNNPWSEIQYGVLHDRRERGHGIMLTLTTTNIARALDAARALDGKGHVRVRRVTYSEWSAPLFDDLAAQPAPSGAAEGGAR